MWKHFDEEVVRKDLKFLSGYGVNCIRIFPTWDDFQPLAKNPVPSSPLYDKFPYAMRVNEKDFLTQKYSSGLSEEKLDQFKKVLDIAKEFGMKVIVSLITGWMSGRLFVPSAFLGKDLIGDPEVVIWQCRFIKDLISELKHYDNIIAWEPGNECNCLTTTAEEYACEMWMMTITNAIRLADGTRPVYSGLHNPELNGKWNLNGQSRYFDVVTTHPYPLFTRYCDIDVLREMRSSLHSAIESAYYTGITGKACLVEEAGSLGPMVISDDFTPDYFEQSLMTSLSVGTTGYLWWCSFNQEFDFAPYDINTVERNLGLAYSNENAKPILKKIKEIAPIVQEIGVLPTPRAEGVVVLPFYNDSWKIAYGSSMLAIQSGVHLDYSCEDRLLKESDHYIVPCITLCSSLSMQHLKKIEEKVENGARLLITYNGGGIGDFEKITGLKVAGRKSNTNEKIFSINEKELRIRPRIILDKGANAKITKEDIDEFLLDAEVGDIYLTQLENPIDVIGYGLKKAKEKGMYVVLNPAPANDEIKPYLNYCDLITPNETELEILGGKEEILKSANATLLVTLGSKGYSIQTKDEEKTYPCIKVKAVDTTAAGDALCGGLCAKLSQGENLENSVAYGSKAASIACTRKGAQQSIPTEQEVINYKA